MSAGPKRNFDRRDTKIRLENDTNRQNRFGFRVFEDVREAEGTERDLLHLSLT